ncbi:sensor histidine kinase [Streptomyces aureus]|uniref:sensor histidine kinase n=1 Tax=Streptomyces aureus TaxID=193461 RepID=UPI001FD758F8|nr:ATP-binding protein [Streptomyces aureus]
MGGGRGAVPDGGRGWSVRAGVRWRLAPRSIRWRLTLIYSALFMAAGAALLGFTYLLASRAAPSTAVGGSSAGSGLPGIDGGTPDPPTLTTYAEALRADQLHQLLVEAGIALAVMTFASVALGWLMAGRVLAPLRTMTAAARRISADNLRQRLAMPGPEDELKAMADTFDDVLGRLEGAFEAQKQFVANASHELRTPLTLQQAIVDVALADPGASVESLRAACLRVRAAGQEQERLIEALLTLARSQGGLRRREFIDLADLVGEHLPDGAVMEGGSQDAGPGPVAGTDRPQEDDESEPRATGPGTGTGDNGNGGTGTGASELSRTGNGEPVTAGPGDGKTEPGKTEPGRTEPGKTEPVKTGNAGPEDTLPHVRAALRSAPLLGDPQLIERLVVNLTDNAVRHNNHGDGERWVRLWTGAEAGCPVLRIDNSGPVIPREQVAGLFQPFRRLGADRTRTQPRGRGRPRDGLGLGLSIVTAVATAHGGTVEAWPRPRGGLSVRVTFPPCAPRRPETDRQGVGSAGE